MRRTILFSVGILSITVALAQAEAGPIRFRNGTLDLPRKTPAQVAADIRSSVARSLDPVSHVLLQFEQPITDELREKLDLAGVTLLDYLSENAFFAAVHHDRLNPAGIAKLPSLTRSSLVGQAQKLHPDLMMNVIHDWMIVDAKEAKAKEGDDTATPAADPTVGVYVKFHPDVPLVPNGEQLVQRYGAKIRSQVSTINVLVIELPYSQIKPLDDEDSVEWIEPPLPLLTPNNDGNRVRTGADLVQAAPYNLNGAGITAFVHDAYRLRVTHQDFGPGPTRATVSPNEYTCTGSGDHTTHVAGTIGGAGIANPLFKGMAPGVQLFSRAFNNAAINDCSLSAGFLYTNPGNSQAAYTEAINDFGADIASNSIGSNVATNNFDCGWEGDYGAMDQLIDNMVRGSVSSGRPMRIVWANGNERQTSRCNDTMPSVPAGYHKTPPPACAKNHITCGAMNSNDDSVTSFTSWGPADDGRMKPDISAPGCQVGGDGGVTSCAATSDTAYSSLCGTSMACPTVAGCSCLLLQDYCAQFPARCPGGNQPDMRNSTLKILLAHTAVDLFNAGPDYQTGYGSIRIKPAIDFMRTGNFLENSVSQGGAYNVLVVVNPGDPVMKVTLAWDDPAGATNVIPELVNDLDLVVFDPSNNQRFPWTLSGLANPSAPAVQTQKNSVDNIEQVVVNSPAAGVYRVQVVGFNVPQGPQPFSLCASPLLVNCSRAGSIGLDRSKYACSSTATITVIDCDLNTNDNVIETVNVTIASTSESGGETVTLTETGPQTAAFRGTINLSTTNSVGVLQVANGDTVTATYLDADDGAGHTSVTVTSTATVDCQPPIISNVQTTNIGARNATVTFSTDESAKGTVRWGTSCGALPNTVNEAAYNTSHSIIISGLSPNTTYYYAVDAVDTAGNSSTDDNGGSCYSFATPNIPELFTQIFPGTIDATNDLDNTSILFYPDPGISHYKACTVTPIAALPTDPAGGTVISTWTSGTGDDGYYTLALTGGATVKLHGLSYGTVFIGTNGYMTFTSGETQYIESLANHFTQPRVAAMFNDLDVRTSGQISYKQLGDRLAVTWLNVPHYNVPAQLNTLQIEMFFDGRITLNYLAIADTDGLAGLSPGGGVSPDFFESNLSNQTAGCGPLPPVAGNGSAMVNVNKFKNLTLSGSDANHDPLVYIVTSLAAHGSLYDPVAAATIASTPYTLAGGGNVVRYTTSGYVGGDSFQFKVNDGGSPPNGGDSNIATETLTVVPPTASNGSASTPENTATNVTLVGADLDGDPLTYIVTSLPAHGTLRDPVVNGTIASVPYTLAGGGNVVRFIPTPGYVGADSFQFKVNYGGAGGDSSSATVSISITPPGLATFFSYPLSSDPGWSTQGQWAFGTPAGFCLDPAAGHTGSNVYGYNLVGCYGSSIASPQYLTTTAINCTGLSGVNLRQWRWLRVDSPADSATIDVSNNGTTWTSVFNNNAQLLESAWSQQTYNISATADNQPTVYVRWGMGPTDFSANYAGWNIDDVEILANFAPCGSTLHGDMNFDTLINGADIQKFISTLTNPGGATQQELCAADCFTDSVLDMQDLNEFVNLELNVTVP